MTLYRLVHISRRVSSQAFSGEGARQCAGRWNSPGTSLIYASASVALACLETLVHLSQWRYLPDRWLYVVEIPDRFVEELKTLPPHWDSEPASISSQEAGDRWAKAEHSVALLVPSVIIAQEKNALINPRHPQFKLGWVQKPTRFRYDPRLKS